MEILNFINKYIKYVYIILAVVFLFFVVKLISKLIGLKKPLKVINKNSSNINKTLDNIQKDLEKISYTTNNTLPMFTNTAFGITLYKSIMDDYKNKRKKNIFKSAINQYRLLSKKK